MNRKTWEPVTKATETEGKTVSTHRNAHRKPFNKFDLFYPILIREERRKNENVLREISIR